MTNKVATGTVSSFMNKTENTIYGGSICVMGADGQQYVGVAVRDIAPGDTQVVEMVGVFEFSKGSGAVAQGAPLYVAEDAGNVQVATSGSVYVGRCELDASAEEELIQVRINFMAVSSEAVGG